MPDLKTTAEELDVMRADMVVELEMRGMSVEEIEKAVNEYRTKWKPAHIEKIRGKILPELLGGAPTMELNK